MTDQATGPTTEGARRPKEACVNCHFFELTRFASTTALSTNEVTKTPTPFVVTEVEREMARSGNFDGWASPDTDRTANILGCHMGVWKEVFRPNQSKTGRYDEVVGKDRKDFCFFWPYHPGMRYEAAEVLQRRASDTREAAKDRNHTLWGLRFAVAGLFISAVVGGFQAYYAREAARAAWAGVAKEEPPGSAQKAPPVPVSPVAPTPAPRNPRASLPATHSR